MSNHITAIVESGVDAFTNLYEVLIYGPAFGETDTPVATTFGTPLIAESRVGDFSPPEETVEPYSTPYKMVTLERLKPKLKVPKTLQIPVRIDKSMDQYTKLRKWKEYYTNLQGEGSWKEAGPLNDGDDGAEFLGRIVVNAFSSNTTDSTPFASWIFEDVICTTVGQPAFNREGSSAVQITTTFTFTRMREIKPTGTNGTVFVKTSSPELT